MRKPAYGAAQETRRQQYAGHSLTFIALQPNIAMPQECLPIRDMIDDIGLVAIARSLREQPFLNRRIAGRQTRIGLTLPAERIEAITLDDDAGVMPVSAEADIDFARISFASDVDHRCSCRAALYRMRRAS